MSDPLGGLGGQAPHEPDSRWPARQQPPEPQPAPLQRRPPATSTIVLLAILCLAYAAELWVDRSVNPSSGMLFRLGALWVPALDAGDWWRLGSYAFLHIGPLHLLMNGYALWVLGREIEWSFGPAAMVGLFSATALAGGLASFAARKFGLGDPRILMAGASGGIFGLFGASGGLLFRVRHRLPEVARRALFRNFVINIAINAVIAFQVPVDSFAHAGGFIAGGLLALLTPLPHFERKGWHLPMQAFLLLSALALAACEGAALARAFNPVARRLEAEGVEARVPFQLVPVREGVARSVEGYNVGIGQLNAPDEPGTRSVQLGQRTFKLWQGKSDRCEEETRVVEDNDERLAVVLCCGAPGCTGKAGEKIAEQIAATLRSTR